MIKHSHSGFQNSQVNYAHTCVKNKLDLLAG